MVDMAMISGAVSALKAAGDAAKLIVASRDANVIREKVLELQTQILSAQQSAIAAQSDQFTLLERVRGLEKQIAEMEEWEGEKRRYDLTGLDPGTLVYVLKPEHRGTQPPHWICANCYDNRRRSILQRTAGLRMGRRVYLCPACKNDITVTGNGPVWD